MYIHIFSMLTCWRQAYNRNKIRIFSDSLERPEKQEIESCTVIFRDDGTGLIVELDINLHNLIDKRNVVMNEGVEHFKRLGQKNLRLQERSPLIRYGPQCGFL